MTPGREQKLCLQHRQISEFCSDARDERLAIRQVVEVHGPLGVDVEGRVDHAHEEFGNLAGDLSFRLRARGCPLRPESLNGSGHSEYEERRRERGDSDCRSSVAAKDLAKSIE